MQINFYYIFILALIIIPLISLFFVNSFLNYPVSVLILFNSLTLLSVFYDFKHGGQYGLLQYILIGHSFIFFALVAYIVILKEKIANKNLNNLEDL